MHGVQVAVVVSDGEGGVGVEFQRGAAQGGAVHEMRLAWLAERPADRTHLLHRTRGLTLRVGFEIGEP